MKQAISRAWSFGPTRYTGEVEVRTRSGLKITYGSNAVEYTTAEEARAATEQAFGDALEIDLGSHTEFYFTRV